MKNVFRDGELRIREIRQRKKAARSVPRLKRLINYV